MLRGIDLCIPAGQRVALVGPSGSGKSAIASLLMRMMDVTEGSVRIDGIDVRWLDLEQLRAQVAVVLQDTVLFTGTIADNIRQGAQDATVEQVYRAAERARASEFIARLPEGFETTVGERGAILSGGQRQRIAVARALLRDVAVVVLDEATTGLDADNAAALRAAIEHLTRGRTTVVITHDEETARATDRIVVVEGGRIRWDGPPDGQIPVATAFAGEELVRR